MSEADLKHRAGRGSHKSGWGDVQAMKPGDRVVAYVTRGDRLLVFRHTMYPEAGVQVPAGHSEAGRA